VYVRTYPQETHPGGSRRASGGPHYRKGCIFLVLILTALLLVTLGVLTHMLGGGIGWHMEGDRPVGAWSPQALCMLLILPLQRCLGDALRLASECI
jgi:hypothetical protein